jgi:hypothetical protein
MLDPYLNIPTQRACVQILVLNHILVVEINLPMTLCRDYDVRPATVVDIQHREAMVVTYCSLQNEGFSKLISR